MRGFVRLRAQATFVWRHLAPFGLRPPPELGAGLRYASAPVAVVLIAFVQYAIFPEPSIAPFVFFYFGISLVSWLGGAGPGLLAVFLSALLANWLFIIPYRHFSLQGPAVAATLLFIVGASAVALLCSRFREALRDAHRAAYELTLQAKLVELSRDALHASEARFRSLFNSIDEGFCIIEVLFNAGEKPLDYRILDVNPAFERQTGLVNPIGKRMRELVPGHEEHWFQIYGKVALTGEPNRFQSSAEGLGRWYEVCAFRVDEPELRRVAILFYDITERIRTAENLREADRRKTEFLGILSHELRNPLAPIRQGVNLLNRAAPGSEQALRALAVIDRQSHQLVRLVDDLLDVTRIEHSKIQLHLENVDLDALVVRISEDYRSLLEKNGVTFVCEPAPEPIFVNGDPIRLSQAIGNLLQNASKFTPAGGSITLSLVRVDERDAEITVRDTGEGIAPNVVPQLFEPFVQAEKTLHRSSGGLGLGLALVKGLVELHGGTVSAKSLGPNRGATFTIRLPVERRTSPPLTLLTEERPGLDAHRILVIEDNVDAAETLRDLLEFNGHSVEVAHSGPDGLARAHAFRPQVVLCDIGLPGMDGFQVARAIRADPDLRAIGLVALSGYAQPQDLEASRTAGFDMHIAKPVPTETLELSMREACAAGVARAGQYEQSLFQPV